MLLARIRARCCWLRVGDRAGADGAGGGMEDARAEVELRVRRSRRGDGLRSRFWWDLKYNASSATPSGSLCFCKFEDGPASEHARAAALFLCPLSYSSPCVVPVYCRCA